MQGEEVQDVWRNQVAAFKTLSGTASLREPLFRQAIHGANHAFLHQGGSKVQEITEPIL